MYSVNIENKSDYLFRVRSKDYEFLVDVKGKGITPPDTLLASLGTCIGVYIRKYAEGAKIPLGEVGISVQAEFAKEPPAYFKTIDVKIELKGAKLDDRRLGAMLEFIKNCPVHNTLKYDPEIKVSIV